MKLCCTECFGDVHLKKHIETYSTYKGDCNFCRTKDTNLIDPLKLSDSFEKLIDIYDSNKPGGQNLIELLKSDWALFPTLSIQKAEYLISAITKNQIKSFNKFQPTRNDPDLDSSTWEEFKKEIKHDNRFFPKSFTMKEKLKELLGYLSTNTDIDSAIFYRARLNENHNEPLKTCEMGTPPPSKTTGGRANPFGISYLYIATTVNTAISELRPHKNEKITIGEFITTEKLDFIDLRHPKKTISPFMGYDDDDTLKAIYSALPLLEKLGEELSKPISKLNANLEYLSSQYLCEFIKSENYHGVIYKSSLGDGDNYAVFDSSKFTCKKTELYTVDNIKIDHKKIL